MPGFLYFLNNVQATPRKEELAALGLAHAFSKVPQMPSPPLVSGFACGEIQGLSGMILFDPERVEPGRAGFFPDRQTWIQLPGSEGKVFVGVDNSQIPTPGELQRVNMLPGSPVELGDERTWIVPIARSWSECDERLVWSDEVPRSMTVLPDGRWGPGEVVPRYRELWEIGDLYCSLCLGDPSEEQKRKINEYGSFSAAAIVLAVNYLVGPAECSLLRILDTHNALQILDALIQRADLRELAQKKRRQAVATEVASSPSSAGPADSTAVIAPPTSI